MMAMVDRLMLVLPAPVRSRVRPGHLHLLTQMLQFGMVGVIGFGVDTAVVYALRAWCGLYVAGTLAYAAAVTTTWWLNRIWTFRGPSNIGPVHRQWLSFVMANLPGLVLNLGTYFLLITFVAFCAANPAVAIFAGALAGMTSNFTLARAVVFR